MSCEYSGWALDQRVLCQQKMVLVCLADGAAQEGECRFTLEWLADKSGLSLAEAGLSLQELYDLGLVEQLIFAEGAKGTGSCVLCKPKKEQSPVERVQGSLWLYVGCCGEATKIGVSRNLEQRFKGFNSVMLEPVECVAAWRLPEDYCRALEKEMLENFSTAKIKGEWVSVRPNAVIDEVDVRLICSGMLDRSERVDFPLRKEG